MPRHSPVLLIALSLALVAGCASRVQKGEAAPIAPPDGSDRASSTPSTRVEVAGLPDWLRIRLADYDAQPGPAAPRAVYEVRYGEGVAYYVMAGCCDQLDPLVDAKGVLVCYPTGGFTGRGDGKCPGALPPGSGRREVWRHR
ncbi:MAG TPA: hypothetical protein VIP05_09290 [Burkholderiaceae bacterium]